MECNRPTVPFRPAFHNPSFAAHRLADTIRPRRGRAAGCVKREEGRLRHAPEAEGKLGRDALAHVHHGGRGGIGAPDVAHALEARREDRADPREANLPSVRVTDQEQVRLLATCPRKLVGTMGEDDSEGAAAK